MQLHFIRKSPEPYYSFPEHAHPFWETVLTIEGEGVQTVAGRPFFFRPGSILILPPQVPHQTRSQGGCREFSISFRDFTPLGDGSAMQLQDDENAHARYLAEWILETVRKDDRLPSLTDALVNAYYQVLAELASVPGNYPPEVLWLQSRLSENLSDPELDVGKLMDDTGYSRGYLRRVFRESVGMPPLSWLNHRRIEAAKQLFRQYPEVLTVREIGSMTGFGDPYYFSKLFRKITGFSPTEYRQRFLEDPGNEAELPDEFR